MAEATELYRQPLIDFCSRVGADPLLVQGAGGNVSWKDGNTLYVKASGTWLSEAATKDIFVPVDLGHMRSSMDAGNFDVTPRVLGESTLRPSIETCFHSLLPHNVVVHLHSVEVIARVIRESWIDELEQLMPPQVKWAPVPYRKPGPNLARALAEVLNEHGDVDVVFLQNHGVVVGGDNVEAVSDLLDAVLDAVRVPRVEVSIHEPANDIVEQMAAFNYRPCADLEVHALAQSKDLGATVQSCWAITPDHVVFLGPEAVYVSSADETKESPAEVIFFSGAGTFVAREFTQAKSQQLRCYYEVMTRQGGEAQLRCLSTSEVHELLNWEAETYRMQLQK